MVRDKINDVSKVMDELEAADEKTVYLEDTSGDSEKFWQIRLVDGCYDPKCEWHDNPCCLGKHWNRRYDLGGQSAGFSQVKDHADEDAAEKFKVTLTFRMALQRTRW